MTPEVEVIGHGGAGYYFPLNHPDSIKKALELGVDRIEVDLQRTADGAAVLVHDRLLEVAPGTLNAVTRLPYMDVRELLPDVLTLHGLLEIVNGRVPVLLDLKGAGLESEIERAIMDHNALGWVTACSISPKAVRNLRLRYPSMRLALTWGGQAKYFPSYAGTRVTYPIFGASSIGPFIATARWCGASEATINYRMLNRYIVRALKLAGIYTIAWTLDTRADIHKALGRGVDAITSNRPDLVMKIMQERGVERIEKR